jgi:hypothetical protein
MPLVAVLSALLAFGAIAFAGGGMDPNGCPGVRSSACSASGIRIDPNGRPQAAATTASSDQGSMIDPDGKPRG